MERVSNIAGPIVVNIGVLDKYGRLINLLVSEQSDPLGLICAPDCLVVLVEIIVFDHRLHLLNHKLNSLFLH
jgi:hypothetical protein